MTGETNSNKSSVGPVRYSDCSLRGDVQAQRKLHHWYADPLCEPAPDSDGLATSAN